MKSKYLLGFFAIISMTQQSLATTFKIVDLTNVAVQAGALLSVRNIKAIAPIYKNATPAYKEPKAMQYSRKLNNGSTIKVTGLGIGDTSISHLKGVSFKVDSDTFKAMLTPQQEPSRLALHVLIEIRKIVDKNNNTYFYQGFLYPDYTSNSNNTSITFEKVQ